MIKGNLEDFQKIINEKISEREDEVILNRVKYALDKDGFIDNLSGLLFQLTNTYKYDDKEVMREQFYEFLIDQLELNE